MKKIIYIIITLFSFLFFSCENLYYDTYYQIPAASEGLLAYYTFNGDVNDSSGNNYQGTINGDTALTVDRFGRENSAYSFDGDGDYIETGITDLPGSFTISSWVFPIVSGPFSVIISKQSLETEDGDHTEFSFQYNGIGLPQLLLGKINTSAQLSTTGLIGYERWYNIVITYDGVYYNCYIDNEKTGFGLLRSEVRTIGSGQILIGTHRFSDSYNNDFKGKIDDVRIYNKALSEKEITELYNLEKVQ